MYMESVIKKGVIQGGVCLNDGRGGGVWIYPHAGQPLLRSFQQKLLMTPLAYRQDVVLASKKMWRLYLQSTLPVRITWNLQTWTTARFYIKADVIRSVQLKDVIEKSKCGDYSRALRLSNTEWALWKSAEKVQGELDDVENSRGERGKLDVDAVAKRQRNLFSEIDSFLKKINSGGAEVEAFYRDYRAGIDLDRQAEKLMDTANAAGGADFKKMVIAVRKGETYDSARTEIIEKKLQAAMSGGVEHIQI